MPRATRRSRHESAVDASRQRPPLQYLTRQTTSLDKEGKVFRGRRQPGLPRVAGGAVGGVAVAGAGAAAAAPGGANRLSTASEDQTTSESGNYSPGSSEPLQSPLSPF
ncbi:unnamed protein product [Lampetra fluviatilis]